MNNFFSSFSPVKLARPAEALAWRHVATASSETGCNSQSNWRVQLARNRRWYWRFSLHVLLHAQIAIAAGVFFESSHKKQTHPENCLERAPFWELLCKRTPSGEICHYKMMLPFRPLQNQRNWILRNKQTTSSSWDLN